MGKKYKPNPAIRGSGSGFSNKGTKEELAELLAKKKEIDAARAAEAARRASQYEAGTFMRVYSC